MFCDWSGWREVQNVACNCSLDCLFKDPSMSVEAISADVTPLSIDNIDGTGTR